MERPRHTHTYKHVHICSFFYIYLYSKPGVHANTIILIHCVRVHSRCFFSHSLLWQWETCPPVSTPLPSEEFSFLTAATAPLCGHRPHASGRWRKDLVQHSAALGLGWAASLAPSNDLRTELFRDGKRKKRRKRGAEDVCLLIPYTYLPYWFLTSFILALQIIFSSTSGDQLRLMVTWPPPSKCDTLYPPHLTAVLPDTPRMSW